MGLGLGFSHPDRTTFEVELERYAIDKSKLKSRSVSPAKSLSIQSGLMLEYERALHKVEGDLDDVELEQSGMMVDTMIEVISASSTPVPTPRGKIVKAQQGAHEQS